MGLPPVIDLTTSLTTADTGVEISTPSNQVASINTSPISSNSPTAQVEQLCACTTRSSFHKNLPVNLLTDPRIIEPKHDDKTRIIGNIRRQYNHSLRSGTNDIRHHAIIGPLGARVYDIPLLRALDNWKEEYKRPVGASSNIIILAKRDISAQIMARRILAMAEPRERLTLADSIEILQTTNPGNTSTEPSKPKIYIVPEESLLRSCNGSVDSASKLTKVLEPFANYTKLNQLRFFYYDKADQMGSDGKQPILDYLLESVRKNTAPGTKEIIRTSFSNNRYGEPSGLYNGYSESKYQFDSPDVLSRTETAPVNRKFDICKTSIGEEILSANSAGKTYSFVRDYAHNSEFIKSSIVPSIEDFLTRRVKHLVIRAHDTQSIDHIISELTNKKIPVAWTQHNETKFQDASGTARTVDRAGLLDKFGKDFNILIHCSILDGEEVPADAVMVFALPEADDQLEAMISPALTPFPDEEATGVFNKERLLWFLEPAKITSKLRSPAKQYDEIQARHRNNVFNSGRVIATTTVDTNNPLATTQTQVNPVTAPSKYEVYTRDYGGDPKWLEYLDKELLPGNKSLKSKIIEKAQEMETLNLTDLNEDALVEVLRGLGSGGDLREVLYYGFEDKIDDIVARFPRFTEIRNLAEANSRVTFISKDLLTRGNPQWINLLNQSFGDNNVIQQITNFIYDNDRYRSYLLSDESLQELISVLLQGQTDFLGDSTRGQAIFSEFFDYLKTKGDLHLIAAQELYPGRIDLAADIKTPQQARKEMRYLFSSGQVSAEPAWQAELSQALGISTEQQQERLADEVADFLFRNEDSRRVYCGDKPTLCQAASALMGIDSLSAAEAQTLRREFFAHINRNGTNPRLAPHIFAARFPETIELAAYIDTEAKAVDFIRSRFTTKAITINNQWTTLLDSRIIGTGIPENKRINLIARFLLSRPNRNDIFSSNENLDSRLKVLCGTASEPINADDKTLFSEFLEFVENQPGSRPFIQLEVQAAVKALYNLSISDSNQARSTVSALVANKKLMLRIIAPDRAKWLNILSSCRSEDYSPASTPALAAVADFLLETHKDILENPNTLTLALAELMEFNLTNAERGGLNGAKLPDTLFDQFCDWMLTQNRELNPIQVAETAKPKEFLAATRIKTLKDSRKVIDYAMKTNNLSVVNSAWHKLGIEEETLLTHLSQYYLERICKQTDLAKLEQLTRLLGIIFDNSALINSIQTDERASSFNGFLNYLRDKLPYKLDVIEIAKSFPKYIEFKDLVQDAKQAQNMVRHLIKNGKDQMADGDFPVPYFEGIDTNEAKADLIADFLWKGTAIGSWFSDRNFLKAATDVLRGAKPAQSPEHIALIQKFAEMLKTRNPKLCTALYWYPHHPLAFQVTSDIGLGENRIRNAAEAIYAILSSNDRFRGPTKQINGSEWLDYLRIALGIQDDKMSTALIDIGVQLAKFFASKANDYLDDDAKLISALLLLTGRSDDINGDKASATNLLLQFENFLTEDRSCAPVSRVLTGAFFPSLLSIDKDNLLELIRNKVGHLFEQKREMKSKNPDTAVEIEGQSFHKAMLDMLCVESLMTKEDIIRCLGLTARGHKFYAEAIKLFIARVANSITQEFNIKTGNIVIQELTNRLIDPLETMEIRDRDLVAQIEGLLFPNNKSTEDPLKRFLAVAVRTKTDDAGTSVFAPKLSPTSDVAIEFYNNTVKIYFCDPKENIISELICNWNGREWQTPPEKHIGYQLPQFFDTIIKAVNKSGNLSDSNVAYL